jgi:hypothetical protein
MKRKLILVFIAVAVAIIVAALLMDEADAPSEPGASLPAPVVRLLPA